MQVFHGLVGLKTHCKLSLLVRRDPDGVTRSYAHIGTGNYNASTARMYTDLSLFTARPEVTRAVPTLAAERAHRVFETVMRRANIPASKISAWIMHAGGRDVLLAMEKQFGLEASDFCYSAAMLREYGNLSSAFVYFVLQAALVDAAPGGWWWMSSFGAGFSCHGALLEVA